MSFSMGDIQKKKIITYSVEELWFLLGTYHPTVVLGIENPYNGRLIEEIKISEQFALCSLLNKEIIKITNDNVIEIIDPDTKKMIEACLFPEKFCWLLITENFKQQLSVHRFYYFADKIIIELVKEDSRLYSLTQISNIEKLEELLRFFIQGFDEDKSANTGFNIEQNIFDDFLGLLELKDENKYKQILLWGGLNVESSDEVISAFTNKNQYFQISFIHKPMDPSTCFIDGMGYIQGSKGGWIVRQYEEKNSKFINFCPSTIAKFQELIFSALK